MGHIDTEVMWTWIQRLLAPLMAVFIAIFGWAFNRFWGFVQEVDDRVSTMEVMQAQLAGGDVTIEDLERAESRWDEKHDRLDERLSKMEGEFNGIRRSLENIESQLRDLNAK